MQVIQIHHRRRTAITPLCFGGPKADIPLASRSHVPLAVDGGLSPFRHPDLRSLLAKPGGGDVVFINGGNGFAANGAKRPNRGAPKSLIVPMVRE